MPISVIQSGGGVLIGSAPLQSARPGDSLAQRVQNEQWAGWLDGPTSVFSGGWWRAATFDALDRHPVVRAALNKHADAESSIRLHVQDLRSKERQTSSPGKPGAFASLLRNGWAPGHHRGRSWVAYNRRKWGMAPLLLDRDGRGVISKIYPISPLLLTWDAASRTWSVMGSRAGEVVSVPERDVLIIPNRLGTSGSLRAGVSALETVETIVNADEAVREAVHGWWKRGARPGVILRHPHAMSDAARDRLRASWSINHEGAANAGRSVVLEEGMEVTVLPLNADQGRLNETRQQLWEELCVALDVPPSVIHLHQRSTFSNITEQGKGWYRDIVAPQLRYVEDDYARLAAEYGAEVEVEHDVDSVLWGTPLDRAEVLAKTDHLTVAEKRSIDSLPYLEGTDRILVNGATVPLDRMDEWVDRRGTASTQDATTAKSAPMAAFDPNDAAHVLSGLSRAKSVDMDALTSGLSDSAADTVGVLAAIAGNDTAKLRRIVGALTKGGQP